MKAQYLNGLLLASPLINLHQFAYLAAEVDGSHGVMEHSYYVNYPAMAKLNKYPCHQLNCLIRLMVMLNCSIWIYSRNNHGWIFKQIVQLWKMCLLNYNFHGHILKTMIMLEFKARNEHLPVSIMM